MGRELFFVSYRRNEGIPGRGDDRHFAYAVHERLAPCGCYQDTHMNSGDFWVQIEAQLQQCSTIVLLLSPGSLDPREDGKPDYFRKEIEMGLALKKTFLIVRYHSGGRSAGAFTPPGAQDELYARLMARNFEEVIYNPFLPEEMNACLSVIEQKAHARVGNQVSALLHRRSAEKLQQFMELKFGSDIPEPALIADVLIRPQALKEQKVLPLEAALCDADVLDQYRRHIPVQLVSRGGQGKSTQLLLLWRSLLDKTDLSRKDERCVVLFGNAEHLRLKSKEDDLLRMLVENYLPGITAAQYQALKDCMKVPDQRPPQARPAAWQYFVVVDGLDEAQSFYAGRLRAQLRQLASIDEGYQNLHVIVTSRSEDRSLFEGWRTLELQHLDPSSPALQSWLEKNIPADLRDMLQGQHGAALANPMMLTLVHQFKKDPLDDDCQVFPTLLGGPACVGQILWNYCQSLVRKYVRLNPDDRRLAQQVMWQILPELAGRRVLLDPAEALTEKEVKRVCRKHLGRSSDLDELFPLCLEIMTKHFRLLTPGMTFSHRLLRDFFAMVHIGNITNQLLDALEDPEDIPPPSEADQALLYDPDVFDATENIDLLVTVLPARCGMGLNGFASMRALASALSGCHIDRQSPPQMLALHFVSMLYPGWVAQCFALNQYHALNPDADSAFIKQMVSLSYGKARVLADLLLQSPDLIPPLAAINVLSMMSQYCRTSWLRSIPREKTIIPELAREQDGKLTECPDLTHALIFARAALATGQNNTGTSIRLVDGYNYIGKVFNSARERIQNHLRLKEGGYWLTGSDLLLTGGAALTDEEAAQLTPESFAALTQGQPGELLCRETAARRAESLRTLAFFWLGKAIACNCVPSLNLMALISEMEQEELPETEGDYRKALSYYLQAAGQTHTLSLYSASKAAQLLAERKAALDADGVPCLPGDPAACWEVTLARAETLFQQAASSTPELGKNSFYRGMLTLSYPGAGTEQEVLRSAMDWFRRAFGRWNQVITLITVLDTSLRLIEAGEAETELTGMARTCLQLLLKGEAEYNGQKMRGTSLARFRLNASGERRADTWTPSSRIHESYMGRLTASLQRHEALLDRLHLTEEARRCLEEAALRPD